MMTMNTTPPTEPPVTPLLAAAPSSSASRKVLFPVEGEAATAIEDAGDAVAEG